ncbi:lamin tail domain-containing protein [Demequina aurantiaca]|uniref:lamin tail domain-containing protein n=1 Tax=Demequina aurantiaca TaxID=676200 RepID=UPI0007841D5C|nr:lamin tail domain-containing protein [Demequina aurantiaca]
MRGSKAALAAVMTLTIGAASVAAGTPALAAADGESAPPVVITEVESKAPDGPDWVEVYNPTREAIALDGLVFKDDDDTHAWTIPAGTSLAAGSYIAFEKSDDAAVGFDFGLGGADSARLFAQDGETLIDSFTWESEAATTWGRCPTPDSDFELTAEATPGAANSCVPNSPEPTPVTAADVVVISEIESSSEETADFIELYNTGETAVSLTGLILSDNDDAHTFAVPEDVDLAAGAYLAFLNDDSDASLGFGLGGSDSARLFDTDGTTLIDSFAWDAHADTTWGRCPVPAIDKDFVLTASATMGAANDCATTEPENSSIIVINEVESNGDDTDWVEVMNIGDAAADISGYVLMDNKDRDAYTLPEGSTVTPGAVFVIDQKTTTADGFDFGLGDPDHVRLFAADGTTPVADFAYDSHATVTWARCPNGTGDFVDSTVSTKGALNNCSTPIRINEVESSDASDGADWIELINISDAPVGITGLVLSDNKDDDVFSIPATPALAAGAIVVFERTDDPATGFDYGLGGGDNVRLFEADGATLIDSYEWSEHAATTYGRCPDGTGEFATTAVPTKGDTNVCAGIVNAQQWPGGEAVSTVDAMDTYAGDMSGIDYDSTTGALWAVQNGDGLLYRIVADDSGTWVPDATEGWAEGKTLRYPDGTGTVDAEGVTVTDAGAQAGVYVSSERNNDASSTSRPSVLKFDVSGAGEEITASAEWNLATDFPGIGANAGMEGITFISDAWLTARGFVDQNTAVAYDPADYAGHGSGLFFVSIEGTAGVYAYALMPGGTFQRIAELDLASLSFSNVADVQFDADRDLLWVVCDDVCDGRIATFALTDEGDNAGVFTASALYERPAGMPNVANEGFAIASASTCTDGSVATFYVDDANTDGFSIRTGTLGCAGDDESEPGTTDPGTTDPDDSTDPVVPDPGTTDPVATEGEGDADTVQCTVTAPAGAAAGQSIAITVDPACAGDSVVVVMYSEPTVIGTFAVGADGVVSFTIPTDLPAGTHTIELQSPDGTVLGSTTIELTAPVAAGETVTASSGELSQTGAPVDGTILLSVLLLLSGAAVIIARRKATVR